MLTMYTYRVAVVENKVPTIGHKNSVSGDTHKQLVLFYYQFS